MPSRPTDLSGKARSLKSEREPARGRLAMRREEPTAAREENPYALAIEGANDGLWDWDAQSDRVFRSHRIQEILGLEPVDMVSTAREWPQVIHPDDRAAYRESVRGLLKGEEAHFRLEYRVLHIDGGHRWVLDRAIARRDARGRVYRMAGSISDITEQKRFEEALRESEQRFRDFADTASDWYWETDQEHRFAKHSVYTAERSVTAFRWLGKRRWDVALDYETEREKWRVHIEALERREPFRDLVYKIARANGAIVYLSVSGKPVYGADGRFKGYRGSGRDVTAAVLAAEHLSRAKRDAEAANAAKSQFLANMSHEFRTPLNAILGFSEVIANEMLGTAGVARYHEYAEDINKSGQHLLKLVEDILDMSKIEAGKFQLREEVIDVTPTIHSCLPLVRRRAEEARVAVVTHLPDDLPAIRADETRLQQILLNLLTNAVKFTPANGRVTVTATFTAERELAITVSDTGVGMTEEDIARALVPFEQVENGFRRGREGAGLGLPLAKRLVELHGGRMDIVSRPGRGTAITVSFPSERLAS